MIDKINKNVVSYITGFTDGEGCIEIHKRNLRLNIITGNTNLEILKRIKSIFKGEIYKQKKLLNYQYRKQSWSWHNNNRTNQKFFLETILPYSSVKRQQILDALEFLKNIKSYHGGKGYNDSITLEERKYREMMYLKIQYPKHRIYTQEEIDEFQKQIDNTTQIQREFDEDVYAYISGFVDAEGCVDTHLDKRSNNIYLRISLINTYPKTLIMIKSVFGGNINLRKKSKNLNKRRSWNLEIQTKINVKFFLTKILPYSIVKKPQIELGLKFLETDNYQIKLLIAQELKKLKDEEYTEEQIEELNEQIEDMNVDKLQHKLEEYK